MNAIIKVVLLLTNGVILFLLVINNTMSKLKKHTLLKFSKEILIIDMNYQKKKAVMKVKRVFLQSHQLLP